MTAAAVPCRAGRNRSSFGASEPVSASGWNPYFDAWKTVADALDDAERLHLWRTDRTAWEHSGLAGAEALSYCQNLACRYAWAVPCDEALEELARHGPLVEIGAGTGYWARLLRDRGVDVLAYDRDPPREDQGSNTWHEHSACWTEVLRGGPERIADHPDRTLLLCWPPYSNPMATHCLHRYRGAALLLIGESSGGCTGDEAFWAGLEAQFEEELSVAIPQWQHLHDDLTVWRRK